MRCIGLKPLRRHDPHIPTKVEFLPSRLSDLGEALPGQEEQLVERPVGVADILCRLPKRLQLSVRQNPLARLLGPDELSWLQTVARALLKAIDASVDGPIVEGAEVPKDVVGL